MSMILVLVFEGSLLESEFVLRVVVKDLAQATELTKHHKKSTKAKLKKAYVTTIVETD